MAHGSIHPFAGRNLAWLLATRGEATPDHEFLVWVDLDGTTIRWSYAQFASDVASVATGLLAHGIRHGDRVCVHMSNRPEFFLTWFALASIGAVTVTTNTRSSVEELHYFLQKSTAVALITEPDLLVASGEAALDVASVKWIMSTEPSAPLTGDTRILAFSSLLGLVPAGQMPSVGPDDPAGIQFTSGTTSRPKGVVWTQANYLWGAKVSASHQRMLPSDRTLTYLPLFHTNAQVYSVMASLWVGATVVLVPRFSASRFWPVAIEEKTTWCSMIPFAIRALRKQPVPEHHFRAWGTGIVVPSWERQFGVATISWWGMTETVTHPIVSDLESPRRAMAMGIPATEYGVRIVDADEQPIEGAGEGLLEILGERGLSLAIGYLDDREADDATWRPDGWMRTGDRVAVDDEGWLTFLERDKDMLKIGAENVAAVEIERVVSSVGGVAEVAVVAGPDPMLDEVAVAFVIPQDPDDDTLVDRIRLICSERLADFKVPRAVFLVDELPRATLEKVAKNVLRERARELLKPSR